MGLRLEGEALHHAKGADIISDGTVLGAIQVPGSGQPIILMPDRGTTGGYPKIATVISADRPTLGRIAPGDTVHFEAVSHHEAVAALRTHRAWLATLRASIRPWRDAATALTEALWQENIISGVTNAQG
jgi:allophanate hydrolase subunit 2